MNQRERRKADTRRAILEAARDLFEREGFEGGTSRRLAAAAGVAPGTLYAHFPDKESILAAVLHQDIAAALERAWSALPPAEAGAEARLLHLAGALLSYYAERPGLSRTLLSRSLFHGGADDRGFDAQVAAFGGRVAALLTDARDRGELPSLRDPETAAELYVARYFLAVARLLRGTDPDPEAALAGLRRALRELLGPPEE